MPKSENPYDRVKNDAIGETGAKMDSWIGGVPLPSLDSIAIFAIDAFVPVLEISPYTALPWQCGSARGPRREMIK